MGVAWVKVDNALENLKKVKEVLLSYDLFNVKRSRQRTKEIEDQLLTLQQELPTRAKLDLQSRLLNEMDELLEKEELYWRQRSHVVWLKDGDKNTDYFHEKATQRKRINIIHIIKDQNAVWVHDEKNIGNETIKFFTALFLANNT